MRRLMTLVVSLMLLCGIFSHVPVRAQDYATCDACGYCKNTRVDPNDPYTVKTDYIVPDQWESCRKCLYPDTTNVNKPDLKNTVLIDPATGRAPTAKPGRYFTQVGCVGTNLSNFRQSGAAASVVQTLLNLLFGVTGGIAFLYIMYGSIVVLTSRADPEKLNYGRRILIGAVVGLAFSFGSIFIINFLATNILKIPGFGQ